MSAKLSIVIPTFNRRNVLPRVLDALGLQNTGDPFEVLVIDDGSVDGSDRFLAGYRPAYPFRSFRQSNAGPATARNRGIREAVGEIVLFLGDDTIPEPGFLTAHLRAHQELKGRRVSVLGYTTWPIDRRVSPFLHHINEYGLQFGYELIQDAESVPFNFFYTSNISIAREALISVGLFDTTFPAAAWEDIELSYRLSRVGYGIVYRPEARVRHHHDVTFASFRRRQEKSGEAAAIFYRKHPELADFLGVGAATHENPEVISWFVPIWAGFCERWDLPGGRAAIDRVLRSDYLRGLRRALAEAADRSGGRTSSSGDTGPG